MVPAQEVRCMAAVLPGDHHVNVTLNAARVKSGSGLCGLMAKLKPCSRRGVVTIHWNAIYTKVSVCRQHAKSAGKQ